MTGRLTSTPWGRTAAARWYPGGLAAITERIPEGHVLSLSAESAHGLYRVTVNRVRSHEVSREVFFRLTDGNGFRDAVDAAIATVWP